MDWGREWLVEFIAEKTRLVLFDRSNNTGDVKIDGSVLEKRPSFKMMGLTFSSKLDRAFYIISIASKKTGVLICPMKFLSCEVVLYLNKSTIRPCM